MCVFYAVVRQISMLFIDNVYVCVRACVRLCARLWEGESVRGCFFFFFFFFSDVSVLGCRVDILGTS